MQAVYIEQYGNAKQLILADVAQPAISANQVLIKVQGAGVNPVDWMVREGFLQDSGDHQLPLILGWDAAGDVAQVGTEVENFNVGDAVFVYAPISEQGAYAEYIAVDSALVAAKPESLDTLTAAAVPLAATTAWQSLMEGCQLKAGDKVLIHNAAGGVGSFAVQIAKAHGAYVIGTASAAKEAYVRGLGVDEFIDYRSQRFEDVITDVDAVLAAVGGDDILQRSLQVIRKDGNLVSLLDDMDADMAKQQGVNFQRWWVMPNAEDLQHIAELIDNGEIKVNIDTVFPLAQVEQAHALSESQRACGKIILNVAA
ncbi:MAG: NADP-dependent oxidoreductase [Pseudomonadales bacterium]|nr:NADP-dependent oxidoreductase [Pseudomonadales bacterium]